MFLSFRNEILKLQANSGLEHLAISQDSLPSQNATLITDYFYTPEKKDNCLIHLSGVHGIEGFLGSLVQREIIKENLRDLPFQVIIVHAVNPYGMANLKRWNPNHVDLNRNALTDFKIENKNFKKFHRFLETGSALEFIKIAPTLFRLGLGGSAQAVASGQTEFPESVFYAGKELQPELRSLHQTLKGLINPKAQLYVLDVHTGLGKFANESLIVDGYGPKEEESFFAKSLQAKMVLPGRDKGFYRTEGTLSQLLKKQWNSFHVFQEFGTYQPLNVLNALIHEKPEQMLEAFFPKSELWRKRCVDIGLLRFRQLVQTLS